MATATAKRPQNATQARKKTMKFRVLHGLHTTGRQQDTTRLSVLQQQLEEGLITQEQFDEQSKGLNPRRVYHAGELVESKTDLLRLNGHHPLIPKFARADDDVAAMVPLPYQTPDTKPAPAEVDDTLSSMSLDQLRKMARSEDIDIAGLTTAEEVAQRIRDVMNG
jgi:hypothetical protein